MFISLNEKRFSSKGILLCYELTPFIKEAKTNSPHSPPQFVIEYDDIFSSLKFFRSKVVLRTNLLVGCLRDNISVYVDPSLREREKVKE